MIVSAQIQAGLSRNPTYLKTSPYKNHSFRILKLAFNANLQQGAKILVGCLFLQHKPHRIAFIACCGSVLTNIPHP
jgi:hypothetical protein